MLCAKVNFFENWKRFLKEIIININNLEVDNAAIFTYKKIL